MIPFFRILAGALLATTVAAQPLLVNTRLQNFTIIEPDSVFQLELRDFFQLYDSPGPIATLTLTMPVQAGERELYTKLTLTDEGNVPVNEGPKVRVMTYELADGGTYEHAYEIRDASLFRWETVQIPFQLIPEEAPISVANFMTYANDGDYRNTIVHRNESTGRVFRQGGLTTFTQLPIIQSGGFRISDLDDKLLAQIAGRGAIVLESTRDNRAGTLSMARAAAFDSATSEFFINLENNTPLFGRAYAVFGHLVNPEADLPALARFADSPVYDLSQWFPSIPFQTIPLYTPFWEVKDSYVRFSTIEVNPGNPDGVSYSWEYANQQEEVSEEEAASRAAFSITIEDGQLMVSPLDTNALDITVTGTAASNQTASFSIRLVSFNEQALDQFPGSTIESGGWLSTFWFGRLNAATSYPWIFHAEHGWQYFAHTSSPSIFQIYDNSLAAWLYTTSTIYPRIFNQSTGVWLSYVRNSGNTVDDEKSLRWFYVYEGESGFWAREDDARLRAD